MKLDVRQAARLLTVSETQIYRWVEDGAIPCYTVHHQPLFSRVELLEWATTRRLPISVELFAGSSARLADALARGGVHAHVPGTDRDAVLAAVVERLPLPASADRALLLAIMRARETQASTGIGLGIAIPHAKIPGVSRFVVAVGRHVAGIEFDAIDARPVHLVVLIAGPQDAQDRYLRLLARLSGRLKQEDVRRKVMVAQTHAEIVTILTAS